MRAFRATLLCIRCGCGVASHRLSCRVNKRLRPKRPDAQGANEIAAAPSRPSGLPQPKDSHMQTQPRCTPGFMIRHAVAADVRLILDFIRKLAEYERLAQEVEVNEAGLRKLLFGERAFAEVIFGNSEGRAVAFALYYHNVSTFAGKPGLYLEDIFVNPEARGRGFGTAMMIYLAKLAVERGCGRFEWSVLDWNRNSIEFYKKLGAQPMDDWTVYRLAGAALGRLAAEPHKVRP